MIGKISRTPLREVWAHEARDFTTWLEENIELLSESLDLEFIGAEREQNAGVFSVDLVAEDESGNPVIIENQLTKSDHDHLGKVITYLAALEAKSAIWLVSDPRPEHVNAVGWLNESTSASFYLVKVEAIRIGDSAPAPLFTLITGPSPEIQNIRQTKKELSDRHMARKRFWTNLLERASEKTDLHRTASPSPYNRIGTSAGVAGLYLSYVIRQHDGQVELDIDQREEGGKCNAEIFRRLKENKAEIEESFGEPLDWLRLEEQRVCRIQKVVETGGLEDEKKWPDTQDAMVDAMVRLEKALRPHLESL